MSSSPSAVERRGQQISDSVAVLTAFDDPADSSKMSMIGQPMYTRKRIGERYKIIGFISSGTYGRVYKARSNKGEVGEFKPDKEGEIGYTGISQSAIREMALCTELAHPNVVHTVEIILEEKCIYIVFEYAEHDLLQIIHHHTQPQRQAVPARTIKSIMFQLLQGLLYLHRNWVMHRDLKPANIMVTSQGEVKIGDLGLARLFLKPLNSLFTGDKVVVTIWYRAPELLLGSRHYTPAVDLWAVGCIFAELLSLRPIFKGEEAKMDNKKSVPFQRNQMQKIVEIMGMPQKDRWPLLASMPEFPQLPGLLNSNHRVANPTGLDNWYWSILNQYKYPKNGPPNMTPGEEGLNLLRGLLEYDPAQRLTAEGALQHAYFVADPNDKPAKNCFEGSDIAYPLRRVSQEDNDIRTSSLPGTKRSGLPDDSYMGRPTKRLKEG
ncbi:Nitrilotriacetate monooxygenase component A [Venturia nashicola]|uniref:Serine/threonine-protein kinase SSN3 n=1 Tax=Venturia nashicola TaxID=86259 RepID=A0A4Z1PTL6_9PEZI|nr:Nitrilotriacetate monooxygenase component A [Venturia nashicola]